LNQDIDSINTVLIDKFPGRSVIYKSFDSVLDDHYNIYPTEFINKLAPGGMSPHELILKEGCPVILLRNLLPAFGLCNGTRLVVQTILAKFN
jgi:ATP-dependent DNA helicase PIF1